MKEAWATGKAVHYSWDGLTKVVNGRGQVREFEYDAAGRLITVVEPEGTVSSTYDANGNVLTVTDGQGTISRSYDALNRVIQYTDVRGNTLHYVYDEVGNLVKLTYPDGKEVSYEYDGAGQLVKVVDWAGLVTSYEYDGNGRLLKEVRPNGTQRSRGYDAVGQLLWEEDWDEVGKVLSRFELRYDAVGNIVEEERFPEVELGLLPPVRMTYSVGNQLATYDGQEVRFDGDGNLVWGPVQGRMGELRFDSRNRLVEAGGIRYQYDAENQRIGVNGIRYVVNSQPVLSQVLVKEENGVRTFYVYGLGLMGEEREGRYRSYHFDVRGSTVALTDEKGKVVERFGYGPYGEVVRGEVTETPFLFHGKFGVMRDGNGLYYMRARFYSSEIKRFLNRDVLVGEVAEGQSLNWFAYVRGDPIKYTDPFGLDRLCGSGQSAIPSQTQIGVYKCQSTGKGIKEKICGDPDCLLREAPLIETDIEALFGTGVRLCCRPAEIALGLVSHCWIKTGKFTVGLAGNPNVTPGQEYESLYITKTYAVDHSNKDNPFSGCERQINVDESCVDHILSSELGHYQGRFSFIAVASFNNCQAYAESVFERCRREEPPPLLLGP